MDVHIPFSILSNNHINDRYTDPSSVQFTTSHWALTLCDWEGNRRFDIALAMRYRLQWCTRLRTKVLEREHFC